jgi:hypothetical protein
VVPPRGDEEENDPEIIHTSMKIEENSTIIVRRSVGEWTPLSHSIQPLFCCCSAVVLWHNVLIISPKVLDKITVQRTSNKENCPGSSRANLSKQVLLPLVLNIPKAQ